MRALLPANSLASSKKGTRQRSRVPRRNKIIKTHKIGLDKPRAAAEAGV